MEGGVLEVWESVCESGAENESDDEDEGERNGNDKENIVIQEHKANKRILKYSCYVRTNVRAHL